ncbi:hypothetical protein BH11VER1_BH11VER1_07910 [soil metagenome]
MKRTKQFVRQLHTDPHFSAVQNVKTGEIYEYITKLWDDKRIIPKRNED